jgi:hypothetical protein
MLLGLRRVVSKPAVHTTAAMASFPVAAVGMHAVGLSTDPNTTTLANGMLDGSFWLMLGMAALFGGIGGIVAELLSLRGHIELPHRVQPCKTAGPSHPGDPRNEVDLGIVSRILLGAAAGLALLAIYTPTSPTALVVNALIAGSAATGVFRVLKGRMLASGQGPVVSAQGRKRGHGAGVRNEGSTSRGQLSVVPETGSSVA